MNIEDAARHFADLVIETMPIDPLGPLWTDVQTAARALPTPDQDYHARVFVRAVFAYIEAVNHWLKDMTIFWLDSPNPGTLDAHTILLLKDRETHFSPTACPKEKPRKQHTKIIQNTALALRAAATLQNLPSDRFFTHHGWRELDLAKKIRDRLTHPRHVPHLTVTPAEIGIVITALNWYTESFTAIITAYNAAHPAQ